MGSIMLDLQVKRKVPVIR